MKNLIFAALMGVMGLVVAPPAIDSLGPATPAVIQVINPGTPAKAGGHEWWRRCGGQAYEGCDGVPRGPYARDYRRGHPGYGERQFGWAPVDGRARWVDRGRCGDRCGGQAFGGHGRTGHSSARSFSTRTVTVKRWHTRTFVGQLYVNRRTGESTFVPAR